jgi:hypothetical protein
MVPTETRSRTVFALSSSSAKGSRADSAAARARGSSSGERTKIAVSGCHAVGCALSQPAAHDRALFLHGV